MTELLIRRLSATVATDPEQEPRVRRMLANLAQRRLDEVLCAATLPGGEWCIRRLDVALPLDLDRPDAAVETSWAAALLDVLRAALGQRRDDIVHYPRVSDALAEMVGSVAAGRFYRAWAWRQVGLLRQDDALRTSATGEVVLAALRTHPQQALVATAHAVHTAGAAAVHRMLGPRGWVQLAGLVAAAHGASELISAAGLPAPEVAELPGPMVVGQQHSRQVAEAHPAAGTFAAVDAAVPLFVQDSTCDPRRPVIALAATLAARSTLAGEFRRSRLRPDPASLGAWAVLIAAQADASLLRRRTAPAVLKQLAATISAAAGSWPHHPPHRRSDHRRATTGNQAGSAVTSTGAAAPGYGGLNSQPAVPPAEPLAASPVDDPLAGSLADHDPAPDARVAWPTPWAGLLFLLATAAEAGVPGELLDDPALASRPLWWMLHRAGLLLVPTHPDDPAVLTLAGLLPDESDLTRDAPPPCAPEQARLAVHARRWATVTAARLRGLASDAADDWTATVRAMALRRGELVVEPGWIEVHLSLDQVSLDVRRAGLDVDPGWVPWLGAVVRFVYA